VIDEVIPVRASVWREGHDAVAATLVVRYLGPRYPQVGETRRLKAVQAPLQAPSVAARSVDPLVRVKPLHVPMTMGEEPFVFHGAFTPDSVGLWTYRVDGWGDPIQTWRHAVVAKLDAGQGEAELSNDLLMGAQLLERAATGVPRGQRDPLRAAAAALRAPGDPVSRAALALTREIDELLSHYPLRELVTRGEQYGVWVDRPLARFGSWYEMFPRSTGGWDADGNPVHGTFATAAAALPRIAEMGFDVRWRTSAWKWPWISRCSARRITRGPGNTASGSPNCRTAPSHTPRTHRRSIRTSTRSTSTTTPLACTTRCCG
jgi:starch synthase (maltosyl-transferring)